MKNIIKIKKLILFCIVMLFIFIYFFSQFFFQLNLQEKELPHVVCTTTMITDAVRRIGQPYIEVTGLMGPGVDPHLYRARARAIESLSQADAIFYHGLHLEGKMADVFQALSKTKKTIAVADVIAKDLLINSDFQGIYDPHIWHDVSLWIEIVKNIAQQLSLIDDEHADYFDKQLKEYLKELKALDEDIKYKCDQLNENERLLVTAHDAFAYFGRRYGIEVVALQGMNTDAQISPSDITKLAQFIIDRNVKTIFFESSIPRRIMDAVKEAVDACGGFVSFGDELYSDALGDYNGSQGTYTSMIRYNVDAIVNGLKQFEKKSS